MGINITDIISWSVAGDCWLAAHTNFIRVISAEKLDSFRLYFVCVWRIRILSQWLLLVLKKNGYQLRIRFIRHSGAPRAKRANKAPWVNKSTHPRKFGNHVTVHRPSICTTGKPMFNFTLSSSFGSIGKLILHRYGTSMLRSVDSCQNRVSADQYHLSLSRAQKSAHRGRVFFEVICRQVTSFQVIAGLSLIFLIHIKYVVFMCNTD